MVKLSALFCLLLGACSSATGSWDAYAGGPGNPFSLARIVDDDAATGGTASLRFGLPLLAPAIPGFNGMSVGQSFDIDRFIYGSGTIPTGTGLHTALLGIDLALALRGHAVPQVEAYRLDVAIHTASGAYGIPFLDTGAVSVSGSTTTNAFSSRGVAYSLSLLGFSSMMAGA